MSWGDLAELLRADPVIAARDHRVLRGSVREGERNGRIVRVLPGLYTEAGRADDVAVLAAAARACEPDAVVVGRAALALLVLPAVVAGIDVASPRRHVSSARIRFRRSRVHPAWVVEQGGLRIQHPAAAAVALADTDEGESIDLVLRERAATLPQLHAALAAHSMRVGNPRRAEVLIASRDEPWSRAERVLHQVLRDAQIGGWRSNYRIETGNRTFYADVAFPAQRWVVEVDGLAVHGSASALAADLERQNLLVLAGWSVLRFTWSDLVDRTAVVIARIRSALGTV